MFFTSRSARVEAFERTPASTAPWRGSFPTRNTTPHRSARSLPSRVPSSSLAIRVWISLRRTSALTRSGASAWKRSLAGITVPRASFRDLLQGIVQDPEL